MGEELCVLLEATRTPGVDVLRLREVGRIGRPVFSSDAEAEEKRHELSCASDSESMLACVDNRPFERTEECAEPGGESRPALREKGSLGEGKRSRSRGVLNAEDVV